MIWQIDNHSKSSMEWSRGHERRGDYATIPVLGLCTGAHCGLEQRRLVELLVCVYDTTHQIWALKHVMLHTESSWPQPKSVYYTLPHSLCTCTGSCEHSMQYIQIYCTIYLILTPRQLPNELPLSPDLPQWSPAYGQPSSAEIQKTRGKRTGRRREKRKKERRKEK